MKKAIILGQGGHARVIRSFIEKKYDDIMLCSPQQENEILSDVDRYRHHDFYLGVGDNTLRRNLFEKLKQLKLSMPPCIGPVNFVAADAKIGQGSFLGAAVVVMTGAEVGENVIVNTGSSVDHDCKVGDHSQLTAGINLGGATIIGTNCFLGIKACTLPGVKIGDHVQVMAGSLVNKDIAEKLVVGGYPAKIIKTLDQDQP